MAYAPHLRFVMGGTIADDLGGPGSEIWSNTINLDPTSDISVFNGAAYLASIQAALAAWYGLPASHMSNHSFLTFLKCNAIGADGRYSDPGGSVVFDYPAPVAGGSLTSDPPVITTAYSWYTDQKRGAGAHGRIFPPNNTSTNNGSQYITGAEATSYAAAGASLLGILRNLGGPPNVVDPVVASNVTATNYVIKGVRVGNVKDVQRRRRDNLVEVYTSHIL
jgi:hypothetical protein